MAYVKGNGMSEDDVVSSLALAVVGLSLVRRLVLLVDTDVAKAALNKVVTVEDAGVPEEASIGAVEDTIFDEERFLELIDAW